MSVFHEVLKGKTISLLARQGVGRSTLPSFVSKWKEPLAEQIHTSVHLMTVATPDNPLLSTLPTARQHSSHSKL